MPAKPLTVIDTSVFVRLFLGSPSCQALWEACEGFEFSILVSRVILEEFEDVLSRPEFGFHKAKVVNVLRIIENLGTAVNPSTAVADCRDPDDNKFLECALAGGASAIVSLDNDLLDLNPWRGVPVVKPREFLILLRA